MMRPDIEEIEARANAATEGPWEWSSPAWIFTPTISAPGGTPILRGAEGYPEPSLLDVEFIASARTDAPNLCAYIRHLEAERAAPKVAP